MSVRPEDEIDARDAALQLLEELDKLPPRDEQIAWIERALKVAILGERERSARLVENPHFSSGEECRVAIEVMKEALSRCIRDGRIHAPADDMQARR